MGTERRVSSIVREEGFKLLLGTGMFLHAMHQVFTCTHQQRWLCSRGS